MVVVVSGTSLCSCAPITCQKGLHAEKRELCPPCATRENQPAGACPCTTGWRCIEDSDVAERRAKERRAVNDAARSVQAAETARLANDQAALEAARRTNFARYQAALDGGFGACDGGSWARIIETGSRAADGGIGLLDRCEALPPPPTPPRKPELTEEQKQLANQRLEQNRLAIELAVNQCQSKAPCPGGLAPLSDWSCKRADGTFPVISLECGELATLAPTALGCPGEWSIRRICPALPRPGCTAGRNQCCHEDGRVVGACGPRAIAGCVGSSTLCRGPGGWCDPCR